MQGGGAEKVHGKVYGIQQQCTVSLYGLSDCVPRRTSRGGGEGFTAAGKGVDSSSSTLGDLGELLDDEEFSSSFFSLFDPDGEGAIELDKLLRMIRINLM